MTMTMIRIRYPRAAGLFLLAGGILLVSGGMAQAQFNPQELLKQVLPGSTENSDDSVASGERACQRYAEKHGLDVRDIGKARRSGTDNLEITLSVEDHNDRYDARCVYDTGDQAVRELVPIAPAAIGRIMITRTATWISGWHSERRMPAKSWLRIAISRMSTLLKLRPAATIRSRSTCVLGLHGDQQSLTCLYDDDQRHAVLAE